MSTSTLSFEKLRKLIATIEQEMLGHKLIIGPDYEVLDRLADGFVSILMDVKIAAFHTEDGEVDPEPVSMQFDFLPDEDEWAMATGEWGDDLVDISKSNLFMAMYYQAQTATVQQSAAKKEEQ